MLTLLVIGVTAVLANGQYAVHGQLAAAQTQRRGNALVDRNIVFFGDLQADIVVRDLVEVHRDDIDLRLDQPIVGGKALDELADNDIGVGRDAIFGDDGGNFFARCHRASGCIGTIKALLGFVSSDLVVCSVRCHPGARL